MKKSDKRRPPPPSHAPHARTGQETGVFQRIFDDQSLLAQLHAEALGEGAPFLESLEDSGPTGDTPAFASDPNTQHASEDALAPFPTGAHLAPPSFATGTRQAHIGTVLAPSSFRAPTLPPSMPGALVATSPAAQSKDGSSAILGEGSCIAGRYHLESQLGVGSMGQVFLARDLRSGDVFALKVLHPWLSADERVVELFTYEYLRMKRIQHPGIARTFALERDPHHKIWFLVMEYIGGISLLELLQRKVETQEGQPPFSLKEAVRFFGTLAPILRFLHEKRFVHRDLKPSHIMWTQPDGSGDLKLLGFGMAAPLMQSCGSSLHLGQGHASLYTAPERMVPGEPATQATDIFSLGVILYQMLTGALPVGMAAMPSDLHAQIPVTLDQVLRCALYPRAEARYSSIDEMFNALKGAVAAAFQAEKEAPAPAAQRPVRPSSLHQTVSIRQPAAQGPPTPERHKPISNADRLGRLRRKLSDRVGEAAPTIEKVQPRYSSTRRDLGFETGQQNITALAFSPDGCFLASASSRDNNGEASTIKLWEVPSWYLLHTIEIKQENPQHLCWSPQGKSLAYSCGKQITIRDVMHPDRRHSMRLDAPCQALSWRADGEALLTTSIHGKVDVWEPHSIFLPTHTELPQQIFAIDTPRSAGLPPYHLVSQHLALIGGQEGYIALWDLLEDELLYQYSDPGSTLSAIAIHPRENAFLSGNTKGDIQFWEPEFHGQTRAWKAHDGPVLQLEVAHHGEWLVSADATCARMWRTSDGELLATFSPQQPLHTLALSPKSRWLAINDIEDHVKLWDISSWNPTP